MTTEATIQTLDHVWKTIKPLNKPMAVMGGLALATWNRIRATRDVDILIDPGEMPIGELIEALKRAQFRSKRDDPLIRLKDAEFLQLWYEPPETLVEVQVDFLIAKTSLQKEAISRRVLLHVPELDIEAAVLSREDLILFKLLAGRMIDRADAGELLRANRAQLDLDYLVKWCERLDLNGDLAEIWTEALPDEPPPINKS